jgi:hypothetical protein
MRAGFHTMNVLLHAVGVVLLFLMAWRLAEDEEPSTGPAVRPQIVARTAAVLFAVHPMTEAVTPSPAAPGCSARPFPARLLRRPPVDAGWLARLVVGHDSVLAGRTGPGNRGVLPFIAA